MNHNRILHEALAQSFEKKLSATFSEKTMQQVLKVVARRNRRAEIWSYILLVAVSLLLIVICCIILQKYGILPSSEEITAYIESLKSKKIHVPAIDDIRVYLETIKVDIYEHFAHTSSYYAISILMGIMLLCDKKVRQIREKHLSSKAKAQNP